MSITGRIAAAASGMGLSVPQFRTSSAAGSLNRSITRLASDRHIVSVRVSGRPLLSAVADAIEGVVICNGLQPNEASAVRDILWCAAESVLRTMSHKAFGVGVCGQRASH